MEARSIINANNPILNTNKYSFKKLTSYKNIKLLI